MPATKDDPFAELKKSRTGRLLLWLIQHGRFGAVLALALYSAIKLYSKTAEPFLLRHAVPRWAAIATWPVVLWRWLKEKIASK